MKMKHFVMGFIFNKAGNKVLLIEKKRPEWQRGRWNGIGGKIEKDETPLNAIRREVEEETGLAGYNWEHVLTFVCPGGTCYVYRVFGLFEYDKIFFKQMEDETLKVWPIDDLPKKMMNNLKWIIPVCLSTIQFPLIVHQNTLGNVEETKDG